MASSHKAVGELSEAQVLPLLLEKGYRVLLPWGDNARYDFVIDGGAGLQRVQVKTGKMTKAGTLVTPYFGKNYTKDEIDLFAIWSPELHKVYMVPVEKVKSGIALRVTSPANPKFRGRPINWAKDYEL